MKLDLIYSVRDIYINANLNPPTEFTSSSRSTELQDILPWNISQMITKTILMMNVKVSKDKNISRWVDQENLIYLR